MKSCDDCTHNKGCAGISLHPVLLRVLALYAGGTTDKFDILFALGDEAEALLEKYDKRIAADCWTKAALLAIAEAVGQATGLGAGDAGQATHRVIQTAFDAFRRFPWRVEELVEQTPDLYQAIGELPGGPAFARAVSKRTFSKICKAVAYGH